MQKDYLTCGPRKLPLRVASADRQNPEWPMRASSESREFTGHGQTQRRVMLDSALIVERDIKDALRTFAAEYARLIGAR